MNGSSQEFRLRLFAQLQAHSAFVSPSVRPRKALIPVEMRYTDRRHRGPQNISHPRSFDLSFDGIGQNGSHFCGLGANGRGATNKTRFWFGESTQKLQTTDSHSDFDTGKSTTHPDLST